MTSCPFPPQSVRKDDFMDMKNTTPHLEMRTWQSLLSCCASVSLGVIFLSSAHQTSYWQHFQWPWICSLVFPRPTGEKPKDYWPVERPSVSAVFRGSLPCYALGSVSSALVLWERYWLVNCSWHEKLMVTNLSRRHAFQLRNEWGLLKRKTRERTMGFNQFIWLNIFTSAHPVAKKVRFQIFNNW
jgi:hypothetical protein